MTLAAGQTLTHYEILGPLGVGGMGEVYRARDTRLEREVAIKVLPEELAEADELLRRFEREARTLASLNHANLAHVYGIDQVGSTCFIAMELVPGEDLAARLARGPLPVDEAVEVCRQIAEGLEAAHEAGVVHRDLKPANVRITPEGVVKILDFGLAKPIRPRTGAKKTEAAESDSFVVTEEGLVLGTPTYMSPEQARGKPVDRRTDVWAFGCVLYECLAGRRAFAGDSLTDVLAAVVGEEPDWAPLDGTPRHVRALVRRCLTRDPRQRLRDIGEARVLLQHGELGPLEPEPAAPAPARRSRTALLVAVGVVLGAAALEALRSDGGNPAEGASVGEGGARVRYFREPPPLDDEGVSLGWLDTLLSPDGRTLAARTSEGLVVRSLDSLETSWIPLPFGSSLAWSPDSRFLAYTDEGAIVRVTPSGESTVQLFSEEEKDSRPTYVAWLDDGRIAFATRSRDATAGRDRNRLSVIPAGGGPVADLAVFEGVGAPHFDWLAPVPGGRVLGVLHRGDDTYSIVTVDDSGVRPLFVPSGGETLDAAWWVPGDFLLFQRRSGSESEAWAVRLSMDPLEAVGESFFVRKGVTGASVSSDGTLAYVEPGTSTHRLVWWSPGGEIEPIGREHDRPIDVTYLSTKHGTILYQELDGSPTRPTPASLWRYDVRRKVTAEIAFGEGWAANPITLADGRIAFGAYLQARSGPGLHSYLLPASGRGEPEEWLEGYVKDVDVDMRHALVMDTGGGLTPGLFVVDLATLERRDFRVGEDRFSTGLISPDGEWSLFLTGTPQLEAYLTRFPSGEGEWQVSTGGAQEVAFSPDGSAIHYVDDHGRLFRVALQTEPEVVLGTPELVGQAEEGTELTARSDESSERFLATQTLGASASKLVVVLDWASELAGR